MASEIRANTLKNRVGLGTVSFTNTGPVVSGIVTANTIRLADDNKIQLGDAQDLEIVHDSANGVIRSVNSGGNMHVESKNHIELNVNYNTSSGSKENALKAIANQGVSLFYNGAQKLQTTNTGATVTGTLVATTFDGNVTGNISGGTVAGSTGTFSGDVSITDKIVHTDDSDTQIRFHADDKFRIELGGITSAFSGLKSTSGTAHAKWGINVATPQAALHIDEAYNHQGVLRVTNGNQNSGYYHQLEMSGTNNAFTLWKHYDGSNNYNSHAHGSTGHIWYIGGNERLRILSSGELRITSSGNNNDPAHLRLHSADVSISTNDAVGVIRFAGRDAGSAAVSRTGALIQATAAATWDTLQSSGYSATHLDFFTQSNSGTDNIAAGARVRITSDGKMGVNTTTPIGTLDVYDGTFVLSKPNASGGERNWRFVNNNVAAGNLGLQVSTAAGGSTFSNLIEITRDGKVGINEGSPAASLHVSKSYTAPTGGIDGNTCLLLSNSGGSAYAGLAIQGTTSGGSYIHFGDTDDINVGNILYDHPTNSMQFHTNASEKLRITSGGQLLLNETSAFDSNTATQFRYDNSGNTADFVFRNRANNGNSRVNIKLSTLNRAANADVSSGIEKYQSGGMAIYNGENTNQYSGMNFFCNGWGSLKLKNGNHSGYDVAHIAAYWGTSNGLMIEQGGPQSGTFKAIRFTTSHYGGERGYIGVTLGGTSYNSSSDYRMKQDVIDLTGAIDRVKSFKPKRFKWKEDPTYTVDGFLAHEASTVVPESVVGEKDAVDSNGDPEYQVMDNSKLVPVLTAALKEAIAKIETLETKVAALEG